MIREIYGVATQFMTVREAAEWIGRSRERVRQLMNQGRFRVWRFDQRIHGCRIYVYREDVKNYVPLKPWSILKPGHGTHGKRCEGCDQCRGGK